MTDLFDQEIYKMSFEELSEKAYEYLRKQQDELRSEWGLSFYEDWYYDQATGLLTFSNDNKVILSAQYQEVGSVSEATNTWLWSWANPHLEKNITTNIYSVKKFGQQQNFEKLSTPKWMADQYDGWEMTAIAGYLLKAKGAYRIPNEENQLFSFLLMMELKKTGSENGI